MTTQDQSVQLAQAISRYAGFEQKDLTVTALSYDHLVKDATFKFLVLDKTGNPLAFILLSNDDYPDAVKLAEQAAKRASAVFGEDLAKFVVMPLFEGEVGNKSFAVFPYLFPLRSGKLARVAARRSLVNKVIDWLEKVAIKTTRQIPIDKLQTSVVIPLEWINTCPQISQALRADALHAVKALETGQWSPRCVFSHNDLWSGNVLLQPSIGQKVAAFGIGEPRIIDWLSCSEEGIPSYDLINYANSTGVSIKNLLAPMQRIHQQTGSDFTGGYFDLLAGFGRLGMNRGEFPIERFAELFERIVNRYQELREL